MARPLRIQFSGAVYHLTARGNARAPIFLDDQDREAFLSVLDDIVDRYHWICHAYCLMGNHYHLLVETPEGNLSQGMRQLNGVYTQKFNRRHGIAGHIFQGRYKSIVVEKDSYLLELCRYIVLNPVRAGLVSHPKDYGWSSFKFTAGRAKAPGFLSTDWVLAQFGLERTAALKQYREFVLAGRGSDPPWDRLVGGCLLGEEEFLRSLLPRLTQQADLTEIPRDQRFAVRPPLKRLLPRSGPKADRDEAIVRAHVSHGYSQQEIAGFVGLHYSTVSRIIQRDRRKSKNKT
jgi:REP element-mobilizing transposase RayT